MSEIMFCQGNAEEKFFCLILKKIMFLLGTMIVVTTAEIKCLFLTLEKVKK